MTDNAVASMAPAQGKRDYFIIARLLIAAVLLVAAVLKTQQLSTQPLRPAAADASLFDKLLADRGFNLFEIHFEFVLAFWLLSGWARRLAWLAALGCFTLFSLITLHKHLAGEASCGCFGAVTVPPIYTLMLDIGIVVMLIVLHPRLRNAGAIFNGPHWRLTVGLAAALVAISISSIPVAQFRPPRLASTANGQQAEMDLAMPEEWVGMPLLLANHVQPDVAKQLQSGRWLVAVVHEGCAGCAKLVPALESKARSLPAGRKARVALIVKGPLGNSLPIPKDELFLLGQLDQSRDWPIPTPTVIWLENGVITDVVVAMRDQDREQVLTRELPAVASQPDDNSH